jgi:hypothetical protein
LGAAVEVHIRKAGVLHRADAVLPNGTVVELQHSGISVPEIRAREVFYGKMLWVFDARDAYQNDRLELRPQQRYTSFRWKHARKSIAYTTAPVRLDLGGGRVFQLRKMSRETPCGGWGNLVRVPELSQEDA